MASAIIEILLVCSMSGRSYPTAVTCCVCELVLTDLKALILPIEGLLCKVRSNGNMYRVTPVNIMVI